MDRNSYISQTKRNTLYSTYTVTIRPFQTSCYALPNKHLDASTAYFRRNQFRHKDTATMYTYFLMFFPNFPAACCGDKLLPL